MNPKLTPPLPLPPAPPATNTGAPCEPCQMWQSGEKLRPQALSWNSHLAAYWFSELGEAT